MFAKPPSSFLSFLEASGDLLLHKNIHQFSGFTIAVKDAVPRGDIGAKDYGDAAIGVNNHI
ncbi:MAG TPA: hypothetical protein VIC51_05645, partial [Psychromonas sp.]